MHKQLIFKRHTQDNKIRDHLTKENALTPCVQTLTSSKNKMELTYSDQGTACGGVEQNTEPSDQWLAECPGIDRHTMWFSSIYLRAESRVQCYYSAYYYFKNYISKISIKFRTFSREMSEFKQITRFNRCSPAYVQYQETKQCTKQRIFSKALCYTGCWCKNANSVEGNCQ